VLKRQIIKICNYIYRDTGTGRSRDSVDAITTRYGLNGPGIEARWGRYFQHLSWPSLMPFEPPLQWVACHSRG